MKRLLIGVAVVAIALIVAALNHEPGTGDPVAHVEPGLENTTTEAEPMTTAVTMISGTRRTSNDAVAGGATNRPKTNSVPTV